MRIRLDGMTLVVVESPYSPSNGYTAENLAYLRAAMAHCLSMNQAPYASHARYTQLGVLDDTIPAERELGMEAGFAWGEKADVRAVYMDHGVTFGMEMGIERAKAIGQRVEMRRIDGWPRPAKGCPIAFHHHTCDCGGEAGDR